MIEDGRAFSAGFAKNRAFLGLGAASQDVTVFGSNQAGRPARASLS
jgi:hypothetical protein